MRKERYGHQEAEEIGRARFALWRASGGEGRMVDYLEWLSHKWALFELVGAYNFTNFLIYTAEKEAKR